MRVLVTGSGGFVGRHLLEFLSKNKALRIWGLQISKKKIADEKKISRKVSTIYGDVTDTHGIKKIIKRVKPDKIFHLAGQSSVPASWKYPLKTFEINTLGGLHIFEALRETRAHTWVQVAGSSEVYGNVLPTEVPIQEIAALKPVNPYGISKMALDQLAAQYFAHYGVKTVRTRAFSHTGPGQSEEYVASNFAKQVALIEKGGQDPVVWVGNLDAVRDFTDVRDVVNAYWLALQKGMPGEVYNVSSGVGHRIGEVLDILLGLAKVKIKVKKEPGRVRPIDLPLMVGDNSRFRKATGWEPKISFKQTLKDLLEDWRSRVDDPKV
jgi:GDP-4-dehydro-6-deoxy-D-mannose reductase